MDENQSASVELKSLLSNISSLFESLVNEKNKFKDEKEKSMSFVETLENEVTNLRKENESLRLWISEKKRACESCVELREKLLIQNRRCAKLEKDLNALKIITNEVPNKVPSPQYPKLLIKYLDELGCVDNQERLQAHGDANIFRSTSKGNTKSLIEEQACGIAHKIAKPNEFNLNEHSRTPNAKINDEQPKKQTGGEDVIITKIKTEVDDVEINPVSIESKRQTEVKNCEFHTPKKLDKSDADFIDSPFHKVVSKKGEGSPILYNRPQGSSPNQLKRKASKLESGPSGGGMGKKLFLKSPNQKTYRSPAKGSKSKFTSNVKFTNSVEAEISLGGVRKLRQTQLNFEFYKSKNNEENNLPAENVIAEVNDYENRFGEDDLILSSPQLLGNSFDEFIKNYIVREQENDKNHSKTVTEPGVDPDETLVDSFYLKESMENRSEESKPAAKSPPKTPSRSPEYNSVPYLYKGSPVRKKSERMKLPGQMCMECNKYYRAALGEIDQGKMQEILDRCSRHRDKHYNVVQTPPGYWKPYLTETMDSTTQDEDTCLD